MRDYEELVKALRQCGTGDFPSCATCGVDNVTCGEIKRLRMRRAADAIEELSKPKWISVTERLPEENGRYLVVLKRYGFANDIELNDEEIKILRYHDGWRLPYHIPEWINETLKQEVIYWMLLPEMPKEDDK